MILYLLWEHRNGEARGILHGVYTAPATGFAAYQTLLQKPDYRPELLLVETVQADTRLTSDEE